MAVELGKIEYKASLFTITQSTFPLLTSYESYMTYLPSALNVALP